MLTNEIEGALLPEGAFLQAEIPSNANAGMAMKCFISIKVN
jgi:hypothetical protein